MARTPPQHQTDPAFRAELVRFTMTAWDRLRAHEVRSIALLGTVPGEGATVLTCLLGQLFAAQRGIRVLLVDGDSQAPALADAAGVDGAAGWYPMPPQTPQDVCLPTAWPGVFVCPHGPPASPEELVEEDLLAAFLRRCTATYDLVLLDCAPLACVAEALRMVRRADATILVVEAERLSRETLKHSCATLEGLDAHFLGTILNRHRRAIPGFMYRRA